MKIISIVGARPQFIKLKPIADRLKGEKGIKHVMVHTGQHYDYEMSKIFFDELSIPKPHYNLKAGSNRQGKQTAIMLERIEKVLIKEKPDMVLVYGDTNSTLAGALGAAKMCIPVAHIEAGLRSYRLDMPEEINRVLTDRISKLLFCPNKNAVQNLKKEGITKGVYLAGDVMYDVFKRSEKAVDRRKIVSMLGLKPKKYILLTIHRKENTDDPKSLRRILDCLSLVREKIVFPVHPRTRNVLQKGKKPHPKRNSNIILVDPVGYLDMLVLEKNAKKIITDSGGVQKEAYWFKVPCVTIRNETEWINTVESGWNILAGKDLKKLRTLAGGRSFSTHLLPKKYRSNKDAAKVIVQVIKKQAGLC